MEQLSLVKSFTLYILVKCVDLDLVYDNLKMLS